MPGESMIKTTGVDLHYRTQVSSKILSYSFLVATTFACLQIFSGASILWARGYYSVDDLKRQESIFLWMSSRREPVKPMKYLLIAYNLRLSILYSWSNRMLSYSSITKRCSFILLRSS